MIHVAHCDPASGEIMQVSTCSEMFTIEGMQAVTVTAAVIAEPERYVLDGERVRPRTEAEMAAYHQPTMVEVKALRYSELLLSDITQVPDYPLPSKVKDKWADYRAALRALGAYETPADWLTNWPERPDGVDIAKPLRDRL